MIIALQAGRWDKDPIQTLLALNDILRRSTSPGDTLMYLSQPTTMMDRVLEVSTDLDLTVIEVIADFMLHGVSAVDYALSTIAAQADKAIVVSASHNIEGMDREFLSYCYYFGVDSLIEVVDYKRMEIS